MADKSQASACPVDHTTREAWINQARAAESSKPPIEAAKVCPVDHQAAPAAQTSWAQTLTSYLPWSSTTASTPAPPARQIEAANDGLGSERVISSIPRSNGNLSDCPVDHGASANAANHEIESGADAVSGNWVYPSEKMFFDAMRRKGFDARETDMKTVVPIHNAVNERAWKEIREWEAPYLAQSK
jgi:cytochrome c heme-lyase